VATMLEAGQQTVRGERQTFPVAKLLGLVLTVPVIPEAGIVLRQAIDGPREKETIEYVYSRQDPTCLEAATWRIS
jgi:hypothetical protein